MNVSSVTSSFGIKIELNMLFFWARPFIDFENSKYSIANRRMFKVEKFLNNWT